MSRNATVDEENAAERRVKTAYLEIEDEKQIAHTEQISLEGAFSLEGPFSLQE